MGVRIFDGEDIPCKSRFGNKMTETCFKYITGVHVTDTQTGLRGIPRNYITSLIDLKGERFEYEMRMLIDACEKVEIKEVPIFTIYDSKEEHQTHFNPFKDSIRIYKILLERFFKFTIVSLSSCVIDVALFAIFCALLDPKINYLIYATIFARIISATYNYLVNYKFVFLSKENMTKSLIKYVALAIIQMSCSALLVHAIGSYVFVGADVVVKIIVDTILFFISYNIQKRFVF